MMERVVRLCAVAATTFLFSAAILVSAANFDLAQAQSRAASRACGKELMKQCSGVPVGVPFGVPVKPTNALQCLKEPRKPFGKMRCIGEQGCAWVR